MAKLPHDKRERQQRLWIPALAYIDDERILRMGSHVGFNGWGDDFRLAHCHFASISDLRHRVWLVERSALSDTIVNEHAIILPHTLVDADEQRHARAWLEKQPLVCVSGLKLEALIDKGLRVYCVEHAVEAEQLLRVQAAGGELPAWSLRLDLPALEQALVEQLGGPAAVVLESPAVRGAVDRILGTVSRGVLSEAAVVNALVARRLVEPGYGYRGATDGRAASVEQIARAVSGMEALFAQVDKRADEQRLIGRDVVDALRGLADDAKEVQLANYGTARRVRLEALSLSLQDDPSAAPSWVVAGEPRAKLTLPLTHLLSVSDVQLWSPKLPAEVREQLRAEQEQKPAPPRWLTPALLLALVLLIGVALLQLR